MLFLLLLRLPPFTFLRQHSLPTYETSISLQIKQPIPSCLPSLTTSSLRWPFLPTERATAPTPPFLGSSFLLLFPRSPLRVEKAAPFRDVYRRQISQRNRQRDV
jgi:hypothetical protein